MLGIVQEHHISFILAALGYALGGVGPCGHPANVSALMACEVRRNFTVYLRNVCLLG